MKNALKQRAATALLLLWGLQVSAATKTVKQSEAVMVDPYAKVQQLLDSGALKQAEAALGKIGADNPIDWASHNILGNFAMAQGRYDEAENHYMKAVEANATRAEIYNNLGVLMLKTAKGNKALEYYLLALKMDPDNAQALYNMAEIYLAQGKTKEGLNYLKRATAVNPTNSAAQFKLIGYLFTLEEFAQVETQCNALLKAHPDDADIRADLGYVLLSYKANDAAAAVFGDAVNKAPKMDRAWYGLGLTALRLGQLDAAEQTFKKAIALQSDRVDYHIDLALTQRARRTTAGRMAAQATGKQIEALMKAGKVPASKRSRTEKMLALLQEGEQ